MQQALWLILALAVGDDPNVLEIGTGLKLNGTLEKAKPRQVYHIKLHEGGTYVIDMVSPNPKALDPFLRLLDASGKTIASDDDGGGGLNARLIFLAPATGTYQIVATSFDGTGVGPFTLTVKRDDARQADALEGRVRFLQSAGKTAEALTAARALVKTRQRLQGLTHWQTVYARGQVRSLEKVASLPASARSALVEAQKISMRADQLRQKRKYGDAAPLYEKALAIYRKYLNDQHPDSAEIYNKLAEEAWASASRIYDIARLRTARTGLGRASFSARESPADTLTACLARNTKPVLAWQNLESSLVRGLLEEIASGFPRPVSPDENRRERDLLAKLDRLDAHILRSLTAAKKDKVATKPLENMLAQRRHAGEELAKLEAAVAGRQVYDLKHIQSRIPADTAFVAWVDIKGVPRAKDPNGEHWACVLRRIGSPAWIKLPGSGGKGAWTKDDDELAARFRQAVSSATDKDMKSLRSHLVTQRLKPLEPALAATKDLPATAHLLVVPAGWMAGIPVDALTDRYQVSYVPSGTMFARLREKPPRGPLSEGKLLAVGDPKFRRPREAGKGDAVIASIRGDTYAPLPGTRAEVAGIARLFSETRAFLQSDAGEQQLYALARKDELKKYRFLHFATHGEVDDRISFNSALILSQDRLPHPAEALVPDAFLDGRLTAEEISKWTKDGKPLLDADLVVLSACQSGLGREAGGEGYLGFSQALFLAGARSLVVSLWKVDDISTSLLMVRFYENLLGRRAGLKSPMPKAEALCEAKRWLRNLTKKEAEALAKALPAVERVGIASGRARPPASSDRPYEHPYYWAAFILIGDPR